MTSRIAVAMSGGVDSSVCAALLKEQGHEVLGLTAKLWADGSRCCSDEDIRRARKVADFLGIPHYVLDLGDEFHTQVIRYFIAEYTAGRTPSPCIVCNRCIKFGVLLDKALALGASAMATGHYARLQTGQDGVVHLLAGVDPRKDQSYFLFALSQKQLAHTLFPLGDMTKPDVAAHARQARLPVEFRGESQDLCFVQPGQHHRIVEQFEPRARRPGRIIDGDGRQVGRHDGIHRFTIGQREGVGVAVGKPVYVTALQADSNTVVVGPRSGVMKRGAVLRDVVWVSGHPPAGSFPAHARVRYKHAAAACTIEPGPDGTARVRFEEPQFAITPGQAAVFYQGEEVLGGGWIERAEA